MNNLFLVKLKKNWKKVTIVMALLLSFVAMALLFIPTKEVSPTSAATLPTDYWSSYQSSSYYDSGSGTEASPYLISTPGQLAKLSAVYNAGSITSKKYFKLTENINLSKHLWVPIGTETHPFNGVIDGNNKAIAGLTQNTALVYAGLIGYAGEIEVKNLNLSGVNITNTSTTQGAVGALVGIINSSSYTAKFSNIVVTGRLETKTNYPSTKDSLGSLIGSILACKSGSIIENVSVNTSLKAENRSVNTTVNPLIGFIQSTNSNLTVRNSFAQSSIKIGETTTVYKKYEGNFGGSTTNALWTFDSRLNNGLPILKNNYWITAANSASYNKTGTEIVSQLATLGFSTGLATTTTVLTLTKNAPLHGNYTTTSSVGTNSSYGTISAVYGELITVNSTADTGYSFLGMGLDTPTTYPTETSFIMPVYSAFLDVGFTPHTYTVTYVGNGATSGSTASSSHTYDQAKKLNANGFERKYTLTYNLNYTNSTNTSVTVAYTFSGWKSSVASGVYGATSSPATAVTLSSVIGDENYVKNLTATDGATVTMTAQWTSAAATLPTPARTGYTFGGWYGESACTSSVGSGGASYTPTANKTLYAKWTVNNYTVTVNPNGGTWSSSTSTQSFTQSFGTTKTIADPTRTGYTFKGWVIYKNAYSADWVEVLYHYNENGAVLFSNETDAKTARTANKLSLLSDMAKYKYNNQFEYLLEYDSISGYNRWIQTSDPTTTSNSVTGYSAVNVSWTANSWGGISKSSETAKTFLDGSPGATNWWYAIGSYQKFTSGDGTLGVPATTISEKGGQRLWVRVADAGLSNLTGITTDCLDSSNNYYFSPQSVTIKAVWAPNNYLLTLNNNYDGNFTNVYVWNKSGGASGSWAHNSNEHTFTFTATPSSAAGPYLRLLHNYMTNGHRYRITIEAKASKAISAVPMRYEAGSGTNSKNINLTTSYQTFSLDVTYSNSTTYQALTFYSANWASGDTFTMKIASIQQIVTYDKVFGNLPGNLIDGNTSTRSTMRDYYTLKGWYTASSGGTQVANASGEIIANVSGYTDANKRWIGTEGKTLYAQWTANTITARMYLNGGVDVDGDSCFTSGSPACTQIWPYNSYWENGLMDYNSTSRVYRNGYTANDRYYNTKADGTGYNVSFRGINQPASGQTDTISYATELASAIGKANEFKSGSLTVDLYMMWNANTIKITLNKNGGSGGTSEFYYKYGINKFYSDSALTNQITDITLPTAPTGWEYYATEGYRGDGTCGGGVDERYVKYKKNIFTSDYTIFASDLCTDIYKNATLKATWWSTFTLDNQGATTAGTEQALLQVYGQTPSDITVPTKTGYTFGGYFTGTNGSGTQYYNASGKGTRVWGVVNSAKTLYAKWTANKQTVSVSFSSSTANAGISEMTNGGTQKIGRIASAISYSWSFNDVLYDSQITLTLFCDCGSWTERRIADVYFIMDGSNFEFVSSSLSGGYASGSEVKTQSSGTVYGHLLSSKSLTADTAKMTITIKVKGNVHLTIGCSIE